MQILIGSAKDMAAHSNTRAPLLTQPSFHSQAMCHALGMAAYSAEELARLLGCSLPIARENKARYQCFANPEPGLQALLSYTGIVYKYIQPQDFTDEDFLFAQDHLVITSFLYGMLRPLDAIKCYRMEAKVRLPETGLTMADYWKPLLTDRLIAAVQADGGMLLDLASVEMHHLFDWRKVKRAVRVVRPDFQVDRQGVLKTLTVYAKMCRGAMTRYALKHRMASVEGLESFTFEGYEYAGGLKEGTPLYMKTEL